MAITTKMIKDAFAKASAMTDAERRAELDAGISAARERRRVRREADKGGPVRWDDDELILSSGRRINTNCQIFGLTGEGEFNVSYGYDGDVPWPPTPPWKEWNEPEDPVRKEEDLTAADMREVADMMIARWQAFKDTLSG